MALRRRTLALATSGLVGLSVVLTGCGADSALKQARVAAVVNGQTITDEQVHEATTQVNSVSAQPVSPSSIARLFVYGKVLLPIMADNGKGVSDDTARSALDKLNDPSPATLEVLKTAVAMQSMPTELRSTFIGKLSSASVAINPRYGSWNPSALAAGQDPIAASSPNWLKNAPTATPSP